MARFGHLQGARHMRKDVMLILAQGKFPKVPRPDLVAEDLHSTTNVYQATYSLPDTVPAHKSSQGSVGNRGNFITVGWLYAGQA